MVLRCFLFPTIILLDVSPREKLTKMHLSMSRVSYQHEQLRVERALKLRL